MLGRYAAGTAIGLALGCTDPPPRAGPEPAHRAAAPAGVEPDGAQSGVVACPSDMVLVEGLFCPEAEQTCVSHHPEYEADPDKAERCLVFARPSRCASQRRILSRYCIDRYEWPNRQGDLPTVLVDFKDARTSCESAGKRLCHEPEWLFACEGENMLPYTYGYERDADTCVMDRPYVERPPRALAKWDACMADPACRKSFEKLDQREPAGAFANCVSPFGAHDMNGNVNEWVERPEAAYPHRSVLKGGWWGPVRDRCRPTVTFHDESDWGYEIGFRCCKDALP